MSEIEKNLRAIAEAVYGKDVRQSIIDAIKQCYEDVNSPELTLEGFRAIIEEMKENGTLGQYILNLHDDISGKLQEAAEERAAQKDALEALDSRLSESIVEILKYEEKTIPVDIYANNRYITNTGLYNSTTNFNCTKQIELKKGETLTARCFSSKSLAVFSEYQGGYGKEYEPYNVLLVGGSSSTGTGVQDYVYEADRDISVIVSFNGNYACDISKKSKVFAFDIPKIKVVKDDDLNFSVYSYHENAKRYIRHTFIHSVVNSSKTTTGATMKTMDVWYPQKIYDGDNFIAQGNANFIHNIDDGTGENKGTGYSGAGDGSCIALFTYFFLDGKKLDIDSLPVGKELDGNIFRFVTKVEHYETFGDGTKDSANYKTVVNNGSFVVESINDIDFTLSANSRIEHKNRLHIKKNNVKFVECHGAMCCGYYPFFNNVMINDENMTRNAFSLVSGTWNNTPVSASDKVLAFTKTVANACMLYGDRYILKTEIVHDNPNRYKKNTILVKTYSDGRYKLYLMPYVSGDVFSQGDTIDLSVHRELDIV